MDNEKPPVIRRRENNGSMEKIRIEDGKETIIPNNSPEKPTGKLGTGEDLLEMEQKMKREINGFLAQRNGIKKDE